MTSWGVRDDLRECRGSEDTARSGSDATAGRARRAPSRGAPTTLIHERSTRRRPSPTRWFARAPRASPRPPRSPPRPPGAPPGAPLDRRGAGRARAQELLGLLDGVGRGARGRSRRGARPLLDGPRSRSVPQTQDAIYRCLWFRAGGPPDSARPHPGRRSTRSPSVRGATIETRRRRPPPPPRLPSAPRTRRVRHRARDAKRFFVL